MFSYRKYLFTFVLILFVYTWFFIFKVVDRPTAINILGANSDISVFTQPESGNKPILDAISSAQKEILIEVYLLSDKEIINALKLAKQRGISVKVMLEKHPFGGGGVNNKAEQELVSFGIDFKWANSKFALTHEKAIIIDENEAYILNQNLTTAAFSKNREYNVINTNKDDVLLIRNIFIADWQRENYTFSNSNLIHSPDNSRAAIKTLIENAKQSIDIEMEVIQDNEMITLLSQKAKNTTIRILAPPVSRLSANKPGLKKLMGSGVLVKTLSSPYIHAKLILVDSQKAYVGSINLSTQSMDKNRELGIILIESESIKVLLETFTKDWDKGVVYQNSL